MNILALIKQVPASQEVETDKLTGSLIRSSAAVRTNPYDLYAIEAALKIKERTTGKVTALSMGPASAVKSLSDAYAMGVDEAVLLSDAAFAGSDVFATSFTISQAIKALGNHFDIIICGRQSTDGDTAQTGPALSAQLGIPVLNWVAAINQISDGKIEVDQMLYSHVLTIDCSLPCVVCVDTSIGIPRAPTLALKLSARKKPIRKLCLSDLPVSSDLYYGATGSPTSVQNVFTPAKLKRGQVLGGDIKEIADKLSDIIDDSRQ